MTSFSEKFIAFIDVLGFKDFVDRSERGTGMPLPELLAYLKYLGDGTERGRFEKYGPTCCPLAPHIYKNLDFRVTQVSDCAIISSEISPAGAMNLISHCWGAVIELMWHGIMCRGYIKRGRIFHSDTQFIGSGYQDAYQAESQVSAFVHEADERGTPYVEVDAEVADYVESQPDPCVKEMFRRMTKRDGDTVVLFPFQRLEHKFIIPGLGQKFDPEEQFKANDILRNNLLDMKKRVTSLIDPSNKKAVAKGKHYLHALDEQLRVCDHKDQEIRKLSAGFNVEIKK